MIACAFLVSAAPLLAPQDGRASPLVRELKALSPGCRPSSPTGPTLARGSTRCSSHTPLEGAVGLEAEKLLKSIEKAWEDSRELPRKGGEHWYWEDERRSGSSSAGKTKKPKGLFIGLHGQGVGKRRRLRLLPHLPQLGRQARLYGSIYPQALEATERGWTDSGTEEWIMTLIDEARRTFGIPADQVFIGGHSMGGYGSWVLSAHADLFAAVPSAGSITPVYALGTTDIIDVQEGIVPNLLNLPVCVFQSTDDPRVPPEPNQAAVLKVEECKGRYGGFEDFTYWEVGDRGHGFPEERHRALLTRIDGFARDPHPERVVWGPSSPGTSFYLARLANARHGRVDAAVDREAGTIEVHTNGEAPGLAVLLSDAVVDMESELTITLNDAEVFSGVPGTSWSTLVRTAYANDPSRTYVVLD